MLPCAKNEAIYSGDTGDEKHYLAEGLLSWAHRHRSVTLSDADYLF